MEKQIEVAAPSPTPVLALLEEVVRTDPTRVAIVYPKPISHGELDRRARVLANAFRALGVGAPDAVVLWTDDSVEAIVGALAAMFVGAAYVPLDIRTPTRRVRFVARDCAARLIFTSPSGKVELGPVPGLRVLAHDESLDAPSFLGRAGTSADIAYVIYTSGSTGTPKGVEITHANLANFVASRRETYGERPVMFPVHPISFDPYQGGVFWALGTGGALVLAGSDELTDLQRLGNIIQRTRPTHLSCATSLYARLLQVAEHGQIQSLELVMVGGEPLSAAVAEAHRAALPSTRLFNEYGPTEATVVATIHEVEWPALEPIPIGKPIRGVRCHVLDERGEPCSDDAEGELWIGGEGVARGYLKRPELTRERFVPDPFGANGARMYRTGDRVLRNVRGELEFLGRVDDQLKLRGNRIEPGEVEAQLRALPGVHAACVVLAKDRNGEPTLVGFVAPKVLLDAAKVRARLALELPPYSVPTHIITLEAMPLGPNGKADRRALAEWSLEREAEAKKSTPLETPTEERLAAIWAEVLGVPTSRISRDDDFLGLGGHSLLVVQIQRAIDLRLNRVVGLSTLFSARSLAEIASVIEASPTSATDDEPEALSARSRLAPVQETFYTIAVLESRPAAYVERAGVRIVGPLEVALLARAAERAVLRHDALRCHVEVERGVPILVFLDSARTAELFSWESLESQDELAVTSLQQRFLAEPMSVQHPPLVKFQLIRVSPRVHYFTIAAHHIVFDGISAHLFFADLWRIYEQGWEHVSLPPPSTYREYARTSRTRLDDGRRKESTEYWRQQLRDLPEPARPPPTYAPGASESKEVESCQLVYRLEPQLVSELRHFARSKQATPFMVLLAGLEWILASYAGTDDVSVGTPIALRNGEAAARCVGCLINTVVIRCRELSCGSTFEELLENVRSAVIAAIDHADVPYIQVIEALQSEQSKRGNAPLFRVFFNYIDQRQFVDHTSDLKLAPFPEHAPAAKFDLTVYAHDWGSYLELQFVYDAGLYDEATIAAMATQLDTLVREVIGDASRPMGTYLSLGPGRAAEPRDDLAFELDGRIEDEFFVRAAAHPERVALRTESGEATYGALRERALSFAKQLLAFGSKEGDRVAIVSDRGIDLVSAMIGCLRAGCVFSVVDPALPDALRGALVQELGPRLVVDLTVTPPNWLAHRDRAPSEPHVELAAAEDITLPATLMVSPETPAYVVFTSGTTGEPKGILSSHGVVRHFLTWQRNRFALGPAERFALLSGLGHDPLIRDVFAPLSVGAELNVPSSETRADPQRLARWIKNSHTSVIHITPALERVLAAGLGNSERLDALKLVFFGGDRLTWASVRSVRAYAPRAGILNGYGLSETPQLMLVHEVTEQRSLSSVPLGHPLPGVSVLVLNGVGKPCSVNQRGELALQTRWLANGYVGPNGATPFDVSLPFKTGDYGHVDAAGRVHYDGRVDRQVKVNGHRVELDAVESALLDIPGITAAHVCSMTRERDVTLYAFVVERPGSTHTARALRGRLRIALGGHSIPSVIEVVPELPLTRNGKVDSRRLVERANEAKAGIALDPTEARTQTEELVLNVWQQVLGVPRIRMRDDFFELGGTSMQAIQMLSMLGEELGSSIPIDLLLRNSSVTAFVRALVFDLHGPERRVLKVNESGELPPLWIMHPVGGHVLFIRRLGALLGEQQPVYGIQAQGLDGTHTPIDDVVVMGLRYVAEIKRHQPKGPYFLAGPSLGGRIAYEVAQRFLASGDSVAFLAVFDSWAQGFPRRKRLDRYLKDKALQYASRVREGGVQELYRAFTQRQTFGQARRRIIKEEEVGAREKADAINRVTEANRHASQRYQMRPYQGHVTVFRAKRVAQWPGVDFSEDACGWRRWAYSVDVVDIECNHQNMMDPPAVSEVATHLRELMERARKAGGAGE